MNVSRRAPSRLHGCRGEVGGLSSCDLPRTPWNYQLLQVRDEGNRAREALIQPITVRPGKTQPSFGTALVSRFWGANAAYWLFSSSLFCCATDTS